MKLFLLFLNQNTCIYQNFKLREPKIETNFAKKSLLPLEEKRAFCNIRKRICIVIFLGNSYFRFLEKAQQNLHLPFDENFKKKKKY